MARLGVAQAGSSSARSVAPVGAMAARRVETPVGPMARLRRASSLPAVFGVFPRAVAAALIALPITALLAGAAACGGQGRPAAAAADGGTRRDRGSSYSLDCRVIGGERIRGRSHELRDLDDQIVRIVIELANEGAEPYRRTIEVPFSFPVLSPPGFRIFGYRWDGGRGATGGGTPGGRPGAVPLAVARFEVAGEGPPGAVSEAIVGGEDEVAIPPGGKVRLTLYGLAPASPGPLVFRFLTRTFSTGTVLEK